ncbi:MAG TPA: hypothetical protein VK641_14185 [Terriglobales bacterium]|nr:hypothetical protein [Terriglobales bacterium]
MSEKLKREFEIYTNCAEPGIDAIAIMVQLLKELRPSEVRAALMYINDRFRNGADTSKEAAGG